MCPKLRPKAVVIMLVCALVLVAGALMSREDYLERLPVYKQYRCAICHYSSSPNSGSDLNNFGNDFKDNGYKWNSTLAGKDSDGDGYDNGIELGDDNGDGVAEVTIERSNPGDPFNHPSSIDPETWSVIKRLFAD